MDMNKAIAAMAGIPIAKENTFINWPIVVKNLSMVISVDELSEQTGIAIKPLKKMLFNLQHQNGTASFLEGNKILDAHFDHCQHQHNRHTIQQH